MRQGVPLVISAPSGAGKSTLTKMLISEFPDISFSISCTTRKMRSGEIDGRDYHFISRAEFEDMVDKGLFAEWAEVHGNFYGTPLEPVQALLAQGGDILFDVDVKGASQIKQTMANARFVFILPPDMSELERRLRLRNEDKEESILRRMANARMEIREALWYDAIVNNDDLNMAYADLRAFYLACRLAPAFNLSLLNSLLAGEA